MGDDTSDRLLKLPEALEMLGMSKSALYALIDSDPENAPPHVKVGRSTRFKRSAIQHWIEAQPNRRGFPKDGTAYKKRGPKPAFAWEKVSFPITTAIVPFKLRWRKPH
jgi:excisionase family DNA binding protein